VSRGVRTAEATRNRAGQVLQLLWDGVHLAQPHPRAKAGFPRCLRGHASSPRTWNATRAVTERHPSGLPARTACAGRRRVLLLQPHAPVPRSGQRFGPLPLAGTRLCGPHAPAPWCQRVPPRNARTNHLFLRMTLRATMRNACSFASSGEPESLG
jgi:hypothetical protein